MSRKAMNSEQFNLTMKRCKEIHRVRYVKPTIHPKARIVVAFDIITDAETFSFTITNNPNPNFDLYTAVNKCLVELSEEDGFIL